MMRAVPLILAALAAAGASCNGGNVVEKQDSSVSFDFGPSRQDSGTRGELPGDGRTGEKDALSADSISVDAHSADAHAADVLPADAHLADTLSEMLTDLPADAVSDPGTAGPLDASKDAAGDSAGDAAPDSGQDADVDPCMPDCAGMQCGDDGCGGSCGTCPGLQDVCQAGVCSCTPACVGKSCGDDGCGGSCGSCPGGQQCLDGACKPVGGGGTLASSYRGTTLVRKGHDYGPTIVQDGGKWHMWWCGAPSQPGAWDSVWYASSSDGLTWSCPVEAILVSKGSLDGSAVCDPSAVKVGGTWYLYYTGINSDIDWSNRVFLATAGTPAGPWNKHPSNSNPQPVLQDPACNKNDPNDYCVGQSTVLYKDGLFYHWYTDSGKGGGAPPSPLVTMLATSADGINYAVQNNGQPVFNHADTSVLYDSVSGMFVMVYGNVDDNQLYWTTSPDGINWLPHDGARNIDVNFANGQNHNPGLAGNVHGHFSGTTFVMYGAGTGWGIWDMDRSEVVFGQGASAQAMCGQCAPGGACGAACGGLGFCGAPGSTNPQACCTCPGDPCTGGQGCGGCLGKFASCKEACKASGFPTGTCAFPGSNDPAACCSCSGWTDCQGCLGGQPDCAAACQSTGAVGGTCAYPDSADPTKCCTCQWDNCKGCLAGKPDCATACKDAGYPGGVCGNPTSTDPSSCCSCTGWTNCQGCLGGQPNCAAACQLGGFSTGLCAYPDSTDTNKCCECKFDNCKGCLVGHPDCASACQGSGYQTGTCAVPDSTNPSQCCSCQAWTNCQGCLGGFADCADACHHSGKPNGWCAYPDSTNPTACCACSPDTGCEGCVGKYPNCMAACQAGGAAGGWCAVPGSQNPGACCACF